MEGTAYEAHLMLLGAKGGKGMMLYAACTRSLELELNFSTHMYM